MMTNRRFSKFFLTLVLLQLPIQPLKAEEPCDFILGQQQNLTVYTQPEARSRKWNLVFDQNKMTIGGRKLNPINELIDGLVSNPILEKRQDTPKIVEAVAQFAKQALTAERGTPAYIEQLSRIEKFIRDYQDRDSEIARLFEYKITQELSDYSHTSRFSALDSSYLDYFLNAFDELHQTDIDWLASQVFDQHVSQGMFGSYYNQVLNSTPLDIRRIFVGYYLKRIPTAQEFIEKHAELLRAIDPLEIHEHVVGTGHFLSNLKLIATILQDNDFSMGRSRNFLEPTEHNPRESIPVIENAPRGAYFTAGAERALIGAAITKNVTHLVAVDFNQQIVDYNRMNVDLLRLSKSRQDYLWLRFEATHAQLLERMNNGSTVARGSLLFKEQFLNWFREAQRNNGMLLMLEKPDNSLSDHAFKNANYLHDDLLYTKLAEMAKAGRIAVLFLDLTDTAGFKEIVQSLHDQNISLSVLDFSDLWYNTRRQSFLPTNSSVELIEAFRPISRRNSVLLMTSWYSSSDGSEYVPRGIDRRQGLDGKLTGKMLGLPMVPTVFWKWNYFGFTFGFLKSSPEVQFLINKLNQNFRSHYEAPVFLSQTLNGGLGEEPPDSASIQEILSLTHKVKLKLKSLF